MKTHWKLLLKIVSMSVVGIQFITTVNCVIFFIIFYIFFQRLLCLRLAEKGLSGFILFSNVQPNLIVDG